MEKTSIPNRVRNIRPLNAQGDQDVHIPVDEHKSELSAPQLQPNSTIARIRQSDDYTAYPTSVPTNTSAPSSHQPPRSTDATPSYTDTTDTIDSAPDHAPQLTCLMQKCIRPSEVREFTKEGASYV